MHPHHTETGLVDQLVSKQWVLKAVKWTVRIHAVIKVHGAQNNNNNCYYHYYLYIIYLYIIFI